MFEQSGAAREAEARRLEGEVAEVCGLLNATTARLVRLIAEVLATESWTGHGIRSPQHWVSWQCGVSSRRAGRLVAMARRLQELPEAEAAFDAGELSEDQVAVISRHVPVHNDAEVTEFARYATVSQLQRVMSSYPFKAEPQQPPAEERRDVRFGFTESGRWRLTADLPADEGALIEQALVAERERLFREADEGERITWADTLLSLVDRSAGFGGTRPGADRSTMLVHLRTESTGGEVAHLHCGPALPDALRRYLACEGRVRPVWETDGKPVSVGRSRRIVPNRTRTLVEDRDRGCRVPGCSRSRRLQVHHIIHWEDGGATDTDNLLCLCPFHHRLHHRGGFNIEGNADQAGGVAFTDVQGRTLKANAPPVPPGDPPPAVARRLGIAQAVYRHPTGERLQSWSVAFSEPPGPDAA